MSVVSLRGEDHPLRRLAAGAIVAALCTGGVVSAPREAEAARSRVLLVEGRGWGHGRGMGQWGAREMGARGATWTRILRHYYRGTRLGSGARDERVRVLVRTAPRLTFVARAPIVATTAGRTVARSPGGIRLRRVGRLTMVDRRAGAQAPWRRVARTVRPVLLRSSRSLWLADPDGERHAYRGTFVVRHRREQLGAINVVRLESYVASVLPREMPALWPRQALRAQAVAARTYAARVKRAARANGIPYDICATAACQVYGGYAYRSSPGAPVELLEHPRTNGAVGATSRRVLVAEGKPILAQYSSSTGGYTAAGGLPYLRPVPDPGDRSSPYHRWRERVPASRIESVWPALGRLEGARVISRSGHGAWGGRSERVRLQGSRSAVVVDGDRFRSMLGLRSDWYRFAWARGRYTFDFDMGYGTRHAAVRRLQLRLLREGFYPADAPRTEFFGPITRASVRRYQRANGISPTGYLGPITRGRLNR